MSITERRFLDRAPWAALEVVKWSPDQVTWIPPHASKPRFRSAAIFPSGFRLRPIDPLRSAGYLSSATRHTRVHGTQAQHEGDLVDYDHRYRVPAYSTFSIRQGSDRNQHILSDNMFIHHEVGNQAPSVSSVAAFTGRRSARINRFLRLFHAELLVGSIG